MEVVGRKPPAILISLLLFINAAYSFYLPGVAPQDFLKVFYLSIAFDDSQYFNIYGSRSNAFVYASLFVFCIGNNKYAHVCMYIPGNDGVMRICVSEWILLGILQFDFVNYGHFSVRSVIMSEGDCYNMLIIYLQSCSL